MAKPELGNKHQCQNCGARFFDLNKSPATCPKCGTIFHAAPLSRVAHHAAVAGDEDMPAGAETVLVSLEEADAGENKVAAVADDDTEIEAVNDTFLEEEEEDTDDVGDLIDGEIGDEEEH
ncbi:MAG: TIGR02300 family protein [Methylocella sp.]